METLRVMHLIGLRNVEVNTKIIMLLVFFMLKR
jgi:hypothetical protein